MLTENKPNQFSEERSEKEKVKVIFLFKYGRNLASIVLRKLTNIIKIKLTDQS